MADAKQRAQSPVPAPKLSVNSATAAAMFEVSETTFFEWVRRGLLPKARKIGSRSVWLVAELQAAADALPVSDDTPLPKQRQAA
jgi:predicted DNA-binding transcriptional regulator AlpA